MKRSLYVGMVPAKPLPHGVRIGAHSSDESGKPGEGLRNFLLAAIAIAVVVNVGTTIGLSVRMDRTLGQIAANLEHIEGHTADMKQAHASVPQSVDNLYTLVMTALISGLPELAGGGGGGFVGVRFTDDSTETKNAAVVLSERVKSFFDDMDAQAAKIPQPVDIEFNGCTLDDTQEKEAIFMANVILYGYQAAVIDPVASMLRGFRIDQDSSNGAALNSDRGALPTDNYGTLHFDLFCRDSWPQLENTLQIFYYELYVLEHKHGAAGGLEYRQLVSNHSDWIVGRKHCSWNEYHSTVSGGCSQGSSTNATCTKALHAASLGILNELNELLQFYETFKDFMTNTGNMSSAALASQVNSTLTYMNPATSDHKAWASNLASSAATLANHLPHVSKCMVSNTRAMINAFELPTSIGWTPLHAATAWNRTMKNHMCSDVTKCMAYQEAFESTVGAYNLSAYLEGNLVLR